MNTSGLYLHIPFCKTKCHYCDFFSVVDAGQTAAFVEALKVELREEAGFLLPPGALVDAAGCRPALRTVYFGGGTPSQLSESEFRTIFDAVEANYDLRCCEEITLEANPDDLTPAYLQALRKLPFNRISLGVQSFLDVELQAINRRHSAQAAIQAVFDCRDAGFDNISIDLMYGLPGQTLESFDFSLDAALSLPVTHLSSYALSWEEGSVLYRKRLSGELKEAPDELLEACFFRLKDRLEAAGFEHYELSNFALKGLESKHNSAYWDGTSYLGVGPSAHSYNGVERRYNPSSLKAYTDGMLRETRHDDALTPSAGEHRVKNNDRSASEQPAGKPDVLERETFFRSVEVLSEADRYNDFVVTRMRTLQGMDVQELQHLFGVRYADYCLKNAAKSLENGLLEMDGKRMKLTRNSLFVSDSVMADLLWV